MSKTLVAMLVAAGLNLCAATALAQSAGESGPPPTAYGPVPGTPEWYDNSGATQHLQQQQPYAEVPYVLPRAPYAYRSAQPHYPFAPEVRNRRDWQRDRDGDGVRNRRDRFPDDPYRY